MRIDAIELRRLAVPRRRPWRTAQGDETVGEALLVTLRSGGHVGWGEAALPSAPRATSEWAGGAFAVARTWIGPALAGESFETGDELQSRLAEFRGHAATKGAFDMAWWSLLAATKGRPLAELLAENPAGSDRARPGRAPRHAATVDVAAELGLTETAGELLEGLARAYARRFRRVKIHVRPGRDVDILRIVRGRFQTEPLEIDGDGSYDIDEHLELFCRMGDFTLDAIEQPFAWDDLADHAQLQETIPTDVGLDESLTRLRSVEQAIDLGCCRRLCLDPVRLGGLAPAVAAARRARASEIPCFVGGRSETPIGAAARVALAARPEFRLAAEILPPGEWDSPEALAALGLSLVDGLDGEPQLGVPDAPGLGAALDPAWLERHTVETTRWP